MQISLKKIALTLNIKLESLFKVMNRCGYSRKLFLNANDTKNFINCLSNLNHSYKCDRLIKSLKNELELLS